ncbi:hypothetical protein [Sandaracinus amylolyticus]|uniref:Uncharacterized protein n=1 Tax=Sandaracinus amylolyticus TaxID=927083 RepID=A0A0F6YF76_9BACT|nr:hypothetical protein [Sandaracinus amylolyticus]AKF03320.1 hypothetical protein DB32_000469 [Sandaracinus amylolyticus]
MISIVSGAMVIALMPVLVAALVVVASERARRAGVRIVRMRRAGPWA